LTDSAGSEKIGQEIGSNFGAGPGGSGSWSCLYGFCSCGAWNSSIFMACDASADMAILDALPDFLAPPSPRKSWDLRNY